MSEENFVTKVVLKFGLSMVVWFYLESEWAPLYSSTRSMERTVPTLLLPLILHLSVRFVDEGFCFCSWQ